MDIYAEITNRMIKEMESGIIPWKKPWMTTGAAISHTTGKPYSLLNQMLLGRTGEYLTFKQVHAEGGFVRKGEKAHMVVFWKWIDKEDEETGEVTQIPFLKYYNVFHIDQCEGITAKHMQTNPNPASPDETAESIINDYSKREGVMIEHREGDAAPAQPVEVAEHEREVAAAPAAERVRVVVLEVLVDERHARNDGAVVRLRRVAARFQRAGDARGAEAVRDVAHERRLRERLAAGERHAAAALRHDVGVAQQFRGEGVGGPVLPARDGRAVLAPHRLLLERLPLRVVAPRAAQRAALEEDGGPHAGAVVQRELADLEKPPGHGAASSTRLMIWSWNSRSSSTK